MLLNIQVSQVNSAKHHCLFCYKMSSFVSVLHKLGILIIDLICIEIFYSLF